jgi:hypothetical protein
VDIILFNNLILNILCSQIGGQRSNRGGWNPPGYNYLGPGNSNNGGPATNPVDQIAKEHDIDYSKAGTSEQVAKADSDFQAKLDKQPFSLGKLAGKFGIGIKQAVEGVTGQLYPKQSSKRFKLNSLAQGEGAANIVTGTTGQTGGVLNTDSGLFTNNTMDEQGMEEGPEATEAAKQGAKAMRGSFMLMKNPTESHNLLRKFSKRFFFDINNVNWAKNVATDTTRNVDWKTPFYEIPYMALAMYLDRGEVKDLIQNSRYFKIEGVTLKITFVGFRTPFITNDSSATVANSIMDAELVFVKGLEKYAPVARYNNNGITNFTQIHDYADLYRRCYGNNAMNQASAASTNPDVGAVMGYRQLTSVLGFRIPGGGSAIGGSNDMAQFAFSVGSLPILKEAENIISVNDKGYQCSPFSHENPDAVYKPTHGVHHALPPFSDNINNLPNFTTTDLTIANIHDGSRTYVATNNFTGFPTAAGGATLAATLPTGLNYANTASGSSTPQKNILPSNPYLDHATIENGLLLDPHNQSIAKHHFPCYGMGIIPKINIDGSIIEGITSLIIDTSCHAVVNVDHDHYVSRTKSLAGAHTFVFNSKEYIQQAEAGVYDTLYHSWGTPKFVTNNALPTVPQPWEFTEAP